MTQFTPGTRIITPSQRAGTIQPYPWAFPGHHLVQFDTGETYWVRTDLLQPLPPDWTTPKKARSKRKSAV
jgi:hypothetical protein